MKAIILAAGEGKRLKELLKDKPKCLITFGTETVLSRQIRFLNELGFRKEDILLVSGYKHEALDGYPVTQVVNNHYDITENSYSLWLALRCMPDEDFIVLDSDLVFEKQLLEDVLNCPHKNTVVSKESKDLIESTGIIVDKDHNVSAIGKQYLNSGYVYLSIFKCASMVRHDFTSLLGKEKSLRTWYTLALTELMQKYPFYNLVVQEKWHEIDFPEDYYEARELFGIGDN